MPSDNRPRRAPPVPIPAFWSGAEALAVVAFLEAIITSVWEAHGDHMIDVYRRADYLSIHADPPSSLRGDHDIPF